jgi:hypothetical protein
MLKQVSCWTCSGVAPKCGLTFNFISGTCSTRVTWTERT